MAVCCISLVVFCVIMISGGFAAPTSNNSKSSIADPHIVGGSNVQGRIPYQISLRVSVSEDVNPTSLTHYCGGSLIQPNIVLSAAHCFNAEHLEELQEGRIFAVGGTNFLLFKPSSTFVSRVLTAIKHPLHNIRGNSHDVAVLKLERSAPIGDENIGLIPIKRTQIKSEKDCLISGWGTTEYGDASAANYLQSAVVPIVPSMQCQTKYRALGYTIYPDMICAGFEKGGVDSCQGDSGGPLVCDGELTGVVSWGYRCALPSVPGVYASVFYHKQWIDEAISNITSSTDISSSTPAATTPKPNNANKHSVAFFVIFISAVISFR